MGIEVVRTGDLVKALKFTLKQEANVVTALSKAGVIVQLTRGKYLVPSRLPPSGRWTPSPYKILETLMRELKAGYQVTGLAVGSLGSFKANYLDEQSPDSQEMGGGLRAEYSEGVSHVGAGRAGVGSGLGQDGHPTFRVLSSKSTTHSLRKCQLQEQEVVRLHIDNLNTCVCPEKLTLSLMPGHGQFNELRKKLWIRQAGLLPKFWIHANGSKARKGIHFIEVQLVCILI